MKDFNKDKKKKKKDSALSPRRPGFDSPSGKYFSYRIWYLFENATALIYFF